MTLRKYSGTGIETQVEAVLQCLQLCCADRERRPSSSQLQSDIDQWAVNKQMVIQDRDYQTNLSKLNKQKVDFFIQYWNAV